MPNHITHVQRGGGGGGGGLAAAFAHDDRTGMGGDFMEDYGILPALPAAGVYARCVHHV